MIVAARGRLIERFSFLLLAQPEDPILLKESTFDYFAAMRATRCDNDLPKCREATRLIQVPRNLHALSLSE